MAGGGSAARRPKRGRGRTTARRARSRASSVGRARTGGGGRRLLFALALVVASAALTPFALVALYAVPEVRPVSTLMLADTLAGRPLQREWRDLDAFPPALVASVLASEDARFCRHAGVDWGAVATVAREASKGERARGASTITMQTVKNLLLPATRALWRKAAEVPLALWADLVWGKRRTLEIYLNVAEWAPGHYGAAAGARAWFGRDVGSLTRAQAAALAVTLPNPALRNPADPGPRQAALARLNERRAREMGPYLGCVR